MHLNPHAVACAMRTKYSGVRGRRARSARYAECATVVCCDLERTLSRTLSLGTRRTVLPSAGGSG